MVTPRPPGTRLSAPPCAKNTSDTATARMPFRDGISPVACWGRLIAGVMASGSPAQGAREGFLRKRQRRPADRPAEGGMRLAEDRTQLALQEAACQGRRGERHDDEIDAQYAEPVGFRQVRDRLLEEQRQIQRALGPVYFQQLQALA